MVQGPSFEAVSTLADPHTPIDQKVQLAKQLKNIIVGQDQRKELAIKHGLVQPLADILSAATRTTGKRRLESNGVSLDQSREWSSEDELRLQAVLIVGSLASAGQSFLAPLCAAHIPGILVKTLSTESAVTTVTAALQALKALAIFWSAADETPIDYDFWSALINTASIDIYDAILRQSAPAVAAKQQLGLVAEILSVLPEDSSSSSPKALITNAGLLDTLASLLVAHAVANKVVWYAGDSSHFPNAPSQTSLPSILAAISTIISGSNYRTHRFILAPCVRDLLTQSGTDASDQRALLGPRHGFSSLNGSLLPPLYIPIYKTVSHNPSSNSFPALKTLSSVNQANGSSSITHLPGDIDHSNAVVGWLLVLIRSMQGFNRVTGLKLLALVANAMEADPMGTSHKSEFLQKTKERQKQLAMLAVPLACRLVQVAHEGKRSDGLCEEKEIREIREQACAVLALLIGGSKELQIAAVDAGAIKHVCPLLKRSFDNVTFAKPMWSARANPLNDASAPATCRLGRSNFPTEISHSMRCRQSALQALEALAAREDSHRKAIIESGVVSYIIDSLKPFSPNAIVEALNNRVQIAPKDGNTTPVILAACRAAQSMSRSVSVLRTSLIDDGIAKPIIQLLRHPSLNVKVASTDVCCNLLPDFSPMREDLSEGIVIKTLAEHARSSSPALRLSSLWALKHLVAKCPKDVKLSTLEELGTEWLVDIIDGEHREHGPASSSGGVSIGLSSANAAGEQVDLLNPTSMDLDEPRTMTPEEIMDEDDEDGEIMFDESSSTHYQASQMRSTLHPPPPSFNSKRYLSSIRDMEQNDEYAIRRDEAGIQEQALDFVRNLLNGDDCAALTDHIMFQIGSAKVYELLLAKLLPLPRSIAGDQQIYNTTALVLSTVHVINHLANSSAKHRQMLIAQTPLLTAMLPHFNHADHRVRTVSVWVVINLTWIENEGDRRDARVRVNELKAIGIEQAVRGLQHDPNLDVRERVKTAIRQFETA